jgi:hypothetical protein
VYWFQSLLTLLLPLALLPFVLVWFWRALRRLDSERLADHGEDSAEGAGAVLGVTHPGPPT